VTEVGDVQLGHRLAQLRELAGMKQAELARQVTWSQAVLSRIEAGERAVSNDELETLLKTIGTPEALDLATILARQWRHLPQPTLDHLDQHMMWNAEEMIAELVAACDAPDARPPFQRRLQEYVEEITQLSGQLLRRDHQVAFIGNIGVGKSTAICRAIELEITGAHGRPVPVLETGGGGITLCEVRLSVGPGYGVKV